MDTKQVIKDVLGQPVVAGDKVVISVTGYRDLQVAEVVKLTPKGIQAKTGVCKWSGADEKTYRSAGMFVKVAA